MAYVSGFLVAVPEGNKAAYLEMAHKGWEVFKDYGCLEMHENWEDDVPEGKVTSFPMAVKREAGEKVVFSWMVWPDKETAQAGFAKMMEDPRMKDMQDMPFDGMRMMWGGFEPVAVFRA
ncbi:DUF1428 domain-containing protein [Rhodalgimonas zhirmunskyi]|uniref:DUF1428 domain-containing protein n=1 Tax=Rhodalgimonas zhirmunskyi TaxID=2964767 RepID=A0AAJ1U7M9_9RHOB|nr:DUF1428 domain-containing protein [Rhodoalgimonas zhirmunskyi]MDQ2093180.1 DUF1428 domain-containing protein [Rhodoalgimonas zhirmunskyi]